MVAGHLTFKILSLSNTVEVPNLRGKSVAEAVNVLQAKDLHLLGAAEDYDSDIPAGISFGRTYRPAEALLRKAVV